MESAFTCLDHGELAHCDDLGRAWDDADRDAWRLHPVPFNVELIRNWYHSNLCERHFIRTSSAILLYRQNHCHPTRVSGSQKPLKVSSIGNSAELFVRTGLFTRSLRIFTNKFDAKHIVTHPSSLRAMGKEGWGIWLTRTSSANSLSHSRLKLNKIGLWRHGLRLIVVSRSCWHCWLYAPQQS